MVSKNMPTAKVTSIIRTILLICMASLIAAIVLLCLVPPVSKDALTHHLAVPKLYMEHGGIHEIPSIPASYNPMNLDLLYLIPLYFGNDIIPKFIHLSFALLTAWLIFGYLKRRLNNIYALLGVIFFLSMPIIVKLSITVYVDLGLIFFSTASLLLLFKWVENGFRFKFLLLSAITCGLAMGTKYNGLINFFLLSLFVPFIYSKHRPNEEFVFLQATCRGMFFVAMALFLFSPWMLRDYLWTHNPIFPLYNHWFNPQYGVSHESVGLFAYRALIYNESWWQIALLPLRLFFQGQDGNPQYFDGRLNPFLLILPFFAFCQFRRDAQPLRIEKKMLLAFSALFLVFTLFSSDLRARYLSPIIPPLVILSTFGVKKVLGIFNQLASRSAQCIGITFLFLIVTFFVGLNAHYILTQYKYIAPFDYLSGRLSRDEYIIKYRAEYPTMQYINKHLSSDAVILFVFMGNRGYYCEREYLFDMVQNKSLLQQVVEQVDTPEDVMAGLESTMITHLLMHSDIFNRWVKTNFSKRGQGVLEEFLSKHARVVYSQGGYSLYALENLLSP